MTYNESDDKPALLNEIRILTKELESLGEKSYKIAMKRKMIRHRIDDLKYKLREMNNNETNDSINAPNS